MLKGSGRGCSLKYFDNIGEADFLGVIIVNFGIGGGGQKI